MRQTHQGRVAVDLPAAEAIGLFTPEGEREWVPGWDPRYPDGAPSEAPGTVFVTHHGTTQTIWVIIAVDRAATTARYARITPGRHAGTVAVRCEDAAPGQCVVHVAYDMTSLSEDPGALDPYTAGSFAAMLDEWRDGVAAHLKAARP